MSDEPDFEDIPGPEPDGYDDWLDGAVVAQIEIRRTLILDGDDETGDVIEVHHRGSDGEKLDLLEAVGLVELSKDSIIRDAMGEIPDEDDD